MGWSLVVTVLCTLHLSLVASFRLSSYVTPYHYDVRLLYDIDPASNYSMYGVVDIMLTAQKETSEIVLHIKDLTINEDKVSLSKESESLIITRVKLDETFDLLTLELDRILKTNQNYTLTIPFYGTLKLGLNGAYISTYVNKNTQNNEYLIATQFEAIFARKAFPCFDEPILKATFRITIGHHTSFTAISNMPLEKVTDLNALDAYWPWNVVERTFKKDQSTFVWDHFQNSVPMSTYLVAFAVSKFSYVDSPPHLSKTKFKIWARSDAIDQTSYAATFGPKMQTYLEEWFNVSYPLPKQDMIAIPDFSAGAMENWGLITYKESFLLYDKKQSSLVSKDQIAETIAHELAHQWFGNLVTMKWWSDLWLNEGFAMYMSRVAMIAVEPAWGSPITCIVQYTKSVLKMDAQESSHPISVPVDDPKHIMQVFDVITYNKGAILVRMMVRSLGENVFKEALHNYMVKFSYSNVEQDDLWTELTSVSQKYGALTRNVTVKRIMDTWTTQKGYPILDVERDYGSKSLTITQKQYQGLVTTNKRTSSSWWIPLRVLCQDEPTPYQQAPLQWLADDEGVESKRYFDHGAGSDEWVLFNPDMIALYRVNYDVKNWLLLADTLVNGKLSAVPVLGRVQLLSDAFELAWTNRLNYTIALHLASYLRHENEYIPLEFGLDALSKIEHVLRRCQDYGAFQKYARRLVGDAYHKAGGLAIKKVLNEHDFNRVKMQALTSEWACRMMVPGCEENAMELFQKWMKQDNPGDNNPIPVDLRSTVYCAAVSRGSVREWRFALARLRRSNVDFARQLLLKALTCTREVWILNQCLEWVAAENSEVRRHDAIHILTFIIKSPVGYYVAKEFIYKRIQDLHSRFKSVGLLALLGLPIQNLLEEFTEEKELDEFLKWQSENSQYLSEMSMLLSQGVDAARVNIAWVARNKRTVVQLLREKAMDSDDEDVYITRRSYNTANTIFISRINCLILIYLFLEII